MHRRFLLAVSLALLAGCASEFKPLSFPPNVVLQDAPPGMAIVYLIRAPHDGATLPVYIDGRLVAKLPPMTYTAAVVAPGAHKIASAPHGGNAEAPASLLAVAAGERRFLHVSAPRNTSLEVGALPIGGTVAISATHISTFSGTRTWAECSELDAQGLMSLGKLVLPERGAL